jgi:hypothetical protein
VHPPADTADPLAQLRVFENSRRADAHFLQAPLQDHAFGADPYDVATLGDGKVVGVLRGRDALVILDRDLHEVARTGTPRSPSALAVYQGRSAPQGKLDPGDVLVTSELEPVIAHYRPSSSGGLVRLSDIGLGDVRAVRDIATGPEGVIYVVSEHEDRLLTLRETVTLERSERAVPRGPLRLARTRSALCVMSLLDHTLSVFRVDRRGMITEPPATATVDGPYWGIAAVDVPGGSDGDAVIIAGGVEDRPLDRRGGFFGYVDSFVYVYRWVARTGQLRKTASINASELGLLVPKAMAFAETGPLRALVTSYGAPKAVELTWGADIDAAPTQTVVDALPGSSALTPTPGGFVAANPLLDTWTSFPSRSGPPGTMADAPLDTLDTRTDRERLGEALFFTGLMAPSSSSDGAKSRFSCETCHFEGYVDGRVHHTGRGDVHATTKPLVGLFNNRPYFSRALDPDLSSVAENEFRVAGAPSPSDPHFEIDSREIPWLANLHIPLRRYDASELRLSLMAFLMTFTHRTNPSASRVHPFSTEERAGAAAFRDRCEGCHEARAAADDPSSRAPFEQWESLVLDVGGPIVWARDSYEMTGVLPYVHERGARVPSLRRLYKKRPYFTNGSAPDILSVLRRARFGPFSHDGRQQGETLDDQTVRAIAAFMDLL